MIQGAGPPPPPGATGGRRPSAVSGPMSAPGLYVADGHEGHDAAGGVIDRLRDDLAEQAGVEVVRAEGCGGGKLMADGAAEQVGAVAGERGVHGAAVVAAGAERGVTGLDVLGCVKDVRHAADSTPLAISCQRRVYFSYISRIRGGHAWTTGRWQSGTSATRTTPAGTGWTRHRPPPSIR